MITQRKTKLIAIVDDDDLMRSALGGLLKAVGLPAQAFASAEEFLNSGQQHQIACLIADIRMPGMSGLQLQATLNVARFRSSSSRHMATQKCGCRHYGQVRWSSWQSRSTTKFCSTVFARLL